MCQKAYLWLRSWLLPELWRAGREYWLAQAAGWGFLWLLNVIASCSAYGQFLPWATLQIFVCLSVALLATHGMRAVIRRGNWLAQRFKERLNSKNEVLRWMATSGRHWFCLCGEAAISASRHADARTLARGLSGCRPHAVRAGVSAGRAGTRTVHRKPAAFLRPRGPCMPTVSSWKH